MCINRIYDRCTCINRIYDRSATKRKVFIGTYCTYHTLVKLISFPWITEWLQAIYWTHLSLFPLKRNENHYSQGSCSVAYVSYHCLVVGLTDRSLAGSHKNLALTDVCTRESKQYMYMYSCNKNACTATGYLYIYAMRLNKNELKNEYVIINQY